jgi:hypothetical protein
LSEKPGGAVYRDLLDILDYDGQSLGKVLQILEPLAAATCPNFLYFEEHALLDRFIDIKNEERVT